MSAINLIIYKVTIKGKNGENSNIILIIYFIRLGEKAYVLLNTEDPKLATAVVGPCTSFVYENERYFQDYIF
jgi:hypothetical protein